MTFSTALLSTLTFCPDRNRNSTMPKARLIRCDVFVESASGETFIVTECRRPTFFQALTLRTPFSNSSPCWPIFAQLRTKVKKVQSEVPCMQDFDELQFYNWKVLSFILTLHHNHRKPKMCFTILFVAFSSQITKWEQKTKKTFLSKKTFHMVKIISKTQALLKSKASHRLFYTIERTESKISTRVGRYNDCGPEASENFEKD